jgi:hypothetical protein
MSDMTHRILAADYHRNGIGGAGFYVAIVETTDDEGTRRFLCVDFSGEPDPDYPESHDPGRFAVLRVDQVAAGNIGMFPLTHPDSGQLIEGTGGAAYRGADYWGNDLRAAIRDWRDRSFNAAMMDRRNQEHEARNA